MSRSGYTDEDEDGLLNLYRENVARAIHGKRGQAFLREMAAALDAMPVKELVADDVVRDDGHVCAIGSVAIARKMNVSDLDVYDGDEVAKTFGIARAMACEIAYENDECGDRYVAGKFHKETPSERWQRMRVWVAGSEGEDGTRRMKREDIIREVQSMLDRGGYQVAKSVVKLAEKPEGTWQKIGPNRAGAKRSMSQAEAARMVAKARERIELVDSTD